MIVGESGAQRPLSKIRKKIFFSFSAKFRLNQSKQMENKQI